MIKKNISSEYNSNSLFLNREAIINSKRLTDIISNECIALNNWMPFNKFMEYVLYMPNLGYYNNKSIKFGISPRNNSDYITAPELTPFFGYTLAKAIIYIFNLSNTNNILEFGAGSGKLAGHLLKIIDTTYSNVFQYYFIIEISKELRKRQKNTIEKMVSPSMLSRVIWLSELPEQFNGVIIGNEVLDSIPVRLFVRSNNIWYERGVTVNITNSNSNDTFKWLDKIIPINLLPVQLQRVNGYHDYLTETHEEAGNFIRNIVNILGRGVILLFDYGFSSKEYYHYQRNTGTLLCHYRHYLHNSPLSLLGLQDITSHVDFTFIAESAINAGASIYGYTNQKLFLLEAGILEIFKIFNFLDIQTYLTTISAIGKLLSEAEMGELFKVIAFGKNITNGIPIFDNIDRSWTLN